MAKHADTGAPSDPKPGYRAKHSTRETPIEKAASMAGSHLDIAGQIRERGQEIIHNESNR